jgi:hypothetical protein
LVFIDADISWKPEDFFRLLNHSVDVVGATYPYKQNDLLFVMKTFDGKVPPMLETGLMIVQGLGMGMFKMSRKAVQAIWDASIPYRKHDTEIEFRAVFELPFLPDPGADTLFETGEDIAMCMKLPAAGFTVYLDPVPILEHSGDRQHFASPIEWLEAVRKNMAEKEGSAAVEPGTEVAEPDVNSTLDASEPEDMPE